MPSLGVYDPSDTAANERAFPLASWALPSDATGCSSSHGWPTPRANDAEKRGDFDATNPRNGLVGAVKAWATPRAEDGERGQHSQHDGLTEDVRNWATPRVGGMAGAKEHADLDGQVRCWHGPTPCPSEDTTAPLGSSPAKRLTLGLNHRFGLFLQGFPVGWLDCVPSATASSRKSRKSSDGD